MSKPLIFFGIVGCSLGGIIGRGLTYLKCFDHGNPSNYTKKYVFTGGLIGAITGMCLYKGASVLLGHGGKLLKEAEDEYIKCLARRLKEHKIKENKIKEK